MVGAKLVLCGAKHDGASLHELITAEGVNLSAGEDKDSIGPVAASAIIPSRDVIFVVQTFGPFSQMVKLHLGTTVYEAR